MGYTPSAEILERYANLLVGFALGGGRGIVPGDVVWINGPDNAKPLFVEVCRAVWRCGGHVLRDYVPANEHDRRLERDFYDLASDAQLEFFAEHYWRGLLDQTDHAIHIRSLTDPRVLREVSPDKILRHRQSFMPAVERQMAKELEDRFTWTVGL